jgi:hypothetical protein
VDLTNAQDFMAVQRFGNENTSEQLRARHGSKPARKNLSAEPHPRRAEFFAPPRGSWIIDYLNSN